MFTNHNILPFYTTYNIHYKLTLEPNIYTGDFDDDYIIIDCPGQIELFSHFTIMKDFVDFMARRGYLICAVYVMDCQFMQDPTKFFS